MGRDALLDRVERVLRDHPGVLTLTGTAGIGKTRLAWELLRRASARHTAWYCDLRHVRGPEELVHAVAGRVCLNGMPPAANAAQLSTELERYAHALLVLDNVEQIIGGGAVVATLLQHAPALRIVVTSREPMRIASERVQELPLLSVDEGVALYKQRAHALGAQLPQTEDAQLQRLVAQLEGLPLAIELAAGRSTLLSTEELLARTQHDLNQLSGHSSGDDPRHRTLAAAILGSWEMLTPVEQRVLSVCSIFPGDFSSSAAEALVGIAPGAATLSALATLRDKSLLQPSRHRGRLSLYVSTRAFARARLGSDAQELLLHHARYFAARATEFSKARIFHGRRPDAELRSDLLRDLHNLELALHTFETEGTKEFELHAALIDTFVTLHGAEPTACIRLLEAALRTPNLPAWLRARLRVARLGALNAAGRATDADADMKELLRAPDLPETMRAMLIQWRAVQLRYQAKHAEAWDEHVRADALMQPHDVPRMKAMNLACMGRLKADLGEGGASRQLNNDARALAHGLGDAWLEGLAIANLAQLAQDEGDLSTAEAFIQDALRLLGQTQEAHYVAIYETVAADILQEQGRAAEAHALYQRAEAFLKHWPNHRCTCLMYAAWSGLCADEGQLAQSDFLLAQARLGANASPNPVVNAAIDLHGLRVARRRAALTTTSPMTPELQAQLSASLDLRFAARMLDSDRRPERRAPPTLRVEALADRFCLNDQTWVDLRKRGAMRRMLHALAEARRQAPGKALDAATLVQAAWPDERLLASAASTRLRVAISTLRKLGLRDVLLTRNEGYLLSPDVQLIDI